MGSAELSSARPHSKTIRFMFKGDGSAPLENYSVENYVTKNYVCGSNFRNTDATIIPLQFFNFFLRGSSFGNLLVSCSKGTQERCVWQSAIARRESVLSL